MKETIEKDLSIKMECINQRIDNMAKCFKDLQSTIKTMQSIAYIMTDVDLSLSDRISKLENKIIESESITNEPIEGQEIWYDIKGWEGKYQISNLSNVKGVSREFYNCKGYLHKVKERILKPQYDKSRKAYYVILSYKGKSERVYLQDIQINENKQQNKETQFKYPKLQYVILQYDLNKKLVRKWNSFKEIEEQTTMNLSAISKCCRNKNKTYKNYYWEKIKLNDLK